MNIGAKLRTVIAALLDKAEKALSSADPDAMPDAKTLETLAKTFEKTAAVTHKMAGLGQKVSIDARNSQINLPPGVTAAPRNVQPINVTPTAESTQTL